MVIKQAKFLTSIGSKNQFKDFGAKEVAVAGKSNVGKSSFINYLANIKNLAKTSSTPGRTRLINYFEMNNGQFMLVDLPGYGYAKVKGKDHDEWGDLIGEFLKTSKSLKCVMLLVDIRHDPSALDLQMVAYLHHYQIPFFVVATKADKLSKAQANRQKMAIATKLTLGKDNILVVSSMKKEGKEAVLARIEELLNQEPVLVD